MNRADIEAVIAIIPGLNDNGVGLLSLHYSKPIAERNEIFARDQASLLASADDCTKVCEWLRDKKKRATVNESHSSYGLKHMMEQETGIYVTNGAFIAAAIHSSFVYKLYHHSLNVCFGISEMSIRRLKLG